MTATARTKRAPTTAREELIEFVKRLPDDEVEVARLFVEWLIGGRKNPVLFSLATAPFDDPSPDELEALQEADRDEARGTVVSHEEARRVLLGKA